MPTQRGQTLLIPAKRSAFDIVTASEAFTAADGTLITALALPWTKHVNATNTTAPTVQSNRIFGENANTISLYYRDDWVPSSADYAVECNVVLITDNNLSICGPVGRLATAATTFYSVRYNTQTNVWQLFKFVAAAGTQLGTDQAATLTPGQNYRARLEMRGSTIAMVVDGATLVSVVDAAIPAPGRAGIRITVNATSATGLHLDDWRAIQ
jgi:hypothetical protein